MKSMCLFRSPELMEVTLAVSERVNDGTISLRRDRVLHADVGLSSALIDLVSAGACDSAVCCCGSGACYEG